MEIAASNVAPDFSNRRSLTALELQRLDDPCVVFEHEGVDSDGVFFWVYTLGGTLDGLPVGSVFGGCTVGDDAIVISGVETRAEADEIASMGLWDTCSALDAELKDHDRRQRALERLNSVGAVEVITQAIRPDADKADAFLSDIEAVRQLRGDGIILAAGTVEQTH